MMERQCTLRVMYISMARMSTMSRKRSSHYQTLEIKPRATQEEIKSAYYRLTKMYHPDKNKGKDAEEKFRKVSEAYEVLSSSESRKQYDQEMMVKSTNRKMTSPQYTSHNNDPRMNWYKDNGIFPESFYDIDAWNRAHYGENFDKMQKIKKDIEKYKKARQRPVEDKIFTEHDISIGTTLIVFVSLILLLTLYEHQDYDKVMDQASIEEARLRVNLEKFDPGNEDPEER